MKLKNLEMETRYRQVADKVEQDVEALLCGEFPDFERNSLAVINYLMDLDYGDRN